MKDIRPTVIGVSRQLLVLVTNSKFRLNPFDRFGDARDRTGTPYKYHIKKGGETRKMVGQRKRNEVVVTIMVIQRRENR
jgi:hypothetical protein